MIRTLFTTAIAVAFTFALQSASAGILAFGTELSGAAESPPVVSAGTGHASALFDDVSNILSVDVSFSGLTGTTTAAHIHCCTAAPGAGNIGVAIGLPGFPAGVMLGSYTAMFDLTSAASFNPAFVTANGGTAAGARARLVGGLQAGTAYLNIHTSTSPGGEIRGFLVPEPSALSLSALALLALLATPAALRRRRTVG